MSDRTAWHGIQRIDPRDNIPKGQIPQNRPYYPDCSTCGHNASGVVANTCTAFVSYPEGDPRGMAGYCGCRCTDDPAVKAWLAQCQGGTEGGDRR